MRVWGDARTWAVSCTHSCFWGSYVPGKLDLISKGGGKGASAVKPNLESFRKGTVRTLFLPPSHLCFLAWACGSRRAKACTPSGAAVSPPPSAGPAPLVRAGAVTRS